MFDKLYSVLVRRSVEDLEASWKQSVPRNRCNPGFDIGLPVEVVADDSIAAKWFPDKSSSERRRSKGVRRSEGDDCVKVKAQNRILSPYQAGNAPDDARAARHTLRPSNSVGSRGRIIARRASIGGTNFRDLQDKWFPSEVTAEESLESLSSPRKLSKSINDKHYVSGTLSRSGTCSLSTLRSSSVDSSSSDYSADDESNTSKGRSVIVSKPLDIAYP